MCCKLRYNQIAIGATKLDKSFPANELMNTKNNRLKLDGLLHGFNAQTMYKQCG
jgi:hypothetical protein